MKAFVFVNDNGAAFSRYKKNEIPAQFVYGVSKLEKMGFEVMVGRGNLLKEGANKRGNSSRLTQSFHFFMFEPIFSLVNAL
ncbi:hypothetical protein SPM30_21085, partial [Enterobacter hormaechei subsp. xiangfangensis]